MRVICVDGDERELDWTLTLCGRIPVIDEAKGFKEGNAALDWLENNPVDVAFMETSVRGMDGVGIANAIRKRWPRIQIVFTTNNPEFAVKAFELRASGYLIKPLSLEKMTEEAEYALSRLRYVPRVAVHTFGTFDVLVDGRTMHFKRAKAKEILAYLIDMEGGSVTRGEIFAALWEDKSVYDRSMQKQVDVNIRSLKDTLSEYGISEILEMRGGFIRIHPEYMDCDLYRFMRGEPEAVRAYRGVYMNPYSWAEFTEAYMTRKEQSGKTVGQLLDMK